MIAEVPEVPYGLKVLDKSGRSVQLSWAAPYDGNSPIKRYMIEYKISKGSWETDIDRVVVPGSQQNVAGVFNLKPATTYHLRIVAENEIGTSEPSDTVTIITAEEAPSGPPSSVRVDALDQHTLKVYFRLTYKLSASIMLLAREFLQTSSCIIFFKSIKAIKGYSLANLLHSESGHWETTIILFFVIERIRCFTYSTIKRLILIKNERR